MKAMHGKREAMTAAVHRMDVSRPPPRFRVGGSWTPSGRGDRNGTSFPESLALRRYSYPFFRIRAAGAASAVFLAYWRRFRWRRLCPDFRRMRPCVSRPANAGPGGRAES